MAASAPSSSSTAAGVSWNTFQGAVGVLLDERAIERRARERAESVACEHCKRTFEAHASHTQELARDEWFAALDNLCNELGVQPSQVPTALHADSIEDFVDTMALEGDSMAALLEGTEIGETVRESLQKAAVEAALRRHDSTPPAKPPVDPALRVLLIGTADAGSPLRALQGFRDTLLKDIWGALTAWRSAHILRGSDDGVYAISLGQVRFPEPTGVYCNMMPIILPGTYREQIFGHDRLDPEAPTGPSKCEASLPPPFRQYLPLINSCPITAADAGKVGYLTIDESPVRPGESQRRPGLHTESPGLAAAAQPSPPAEAAQPVQQTAPSAPSGRWVPPENTMPTFMWGGGHYVRGAPGPASRGQFEGGIYMASTVADSCCVWNAKAEAAAVGKLGSVEHVRAHLGEGYRLPAQTMVWLTDATPHESLPLPPAADSAPRRQFFRLVTSRVSGWYRAHSTPNELGVVPPPEVPILDGDKFA